MKSVLLSILLASSALTLAAGDNPSLNGKWQIHNDISGNESDMACTFAQKDSQLTGTCIGQKDPSTSAERLMVRM